MIKEANEKYGKQNWIYHQDRASSHSSEKTIKFLKKSKIKFIEPSKWMPKLLDRVPSYFRLFSYFKRKKEQHNMSFQIKQCLTNIPITMIHRMLKAMPRRIRQAYMSKGGHTYKIITKIIIKIQTLTFC